MSVDSSLTILDLLRRAASEHRDEPALLTKWNGRYEAESWNELLSAVCKLALMLTRTGIQPGELAVHVGHNSRNWVLFDLACHLYGLVHVPLHASLTGPQLLAQIRHCGADQVFVSDDEQHQKLASADPSLRILRFDQTEPTAMPTGSLGEPRPNDLATILYTSGTTGEPKGVMLSQRNLSFNAQAVVEMYGTPVDRETRLNILPLSHVFARTCDLYAWLVRGSVLAIAESRDTVLDDLQAVRPTTINGVPYFFDRLRRLLFERSLDQQPGALKQLLGGRIRSCASGGAALSQATIDFFEQQEVPLLQGYGLTETSPVITMTPRDANRPGTCGQPLAGIEVRLADDGEVITRGPHVMQGYYKDSAATAEVIREGWLHTGDLGEFDDHGYLRIIGRKKEMIVLSTGRKIAPSLIENRLLHDPLVAQLMVVGEGRSHLAALVVPNPDALRAEIIKRGIMVLSREQAIVHPQVLAIYLERFAEYLADLSPQEQIRHVALVPRAFSPEHGEMTAKLSLRREVVARNFAVEIDRMYQGH